MMRRVFNVACLASAILFGCTIVVWLWTYNIDPRDVGVSVSDTFHVSVTRGWMFFYNDAEYGPYRGSIIALDGDGVFAKEQRFGPRFGVYWRYFRWAESGAVLWTAAVTLLYPLALFAVLPATWVWWRWRNKANKKR